jgi:methylenetetrahydrofolate reductase (NADPH)
VTAVGHATLVESFMRTRFELVPLRGVEDQFAHLPSDAVVTVTSSPSKGVGATLELARTLRERGFEVVPHLAARLTTGPGELRAVLGHLADLDVREVFVVAGDAAEPAGPYEGAVDLLRAMEDLGHGLERIGVTGYPESHAFIPDETTIRVMHEKARHATHIVSQICYDPVTIGGWVGAVRARGVTLPIHLGIPGVVDTSRLLRISLRVGLGDSVRFLSKQSGVARRLLSGYRPDDLVEGLAPLACDPHAGIAGWHLFTFNEVANTEQWRRQLLARRTGVA